MSSSNPTISTSSLTPTEVLGSIQNSVDRIRDRLEDIELSLERLKMSLPLDFAGPSSVADSDPGTPMPAAYLSGGALNANPNASIGGAISTVEVDIASLNNLFDNVSQAESVSGDVEYRCLYVKNTSGGIWTTPNVWISSTTPSTDSVIAIGLDPAGKNGVADTPADESTAPSGVTFTSPTTKIGGLTLSSLGASEFQAIWVRRTISASAAEAFQDEVSISIED